MKDSGLWSLSTSLAPSTSPIGEKDLRAATAPDELQEGLEHVLRGVALHRNGLDLASGASWTPAACFVPVLRSDIDKEEDELDSS
jgi:hypothetical protein